jgi:hypothetical protein
MLGKGKYPLDCSHSTTVLQNPTDYWVLSIKGLFSRCFDLLASGFASASRQRSRRKIKGLYFCNTVVIKGEFLLHKRRKESLPCTNAGRPRSVGKPAFARRRRCRFSAHAAQIPFRRSRLVGRCVSNTSLSEYGYHGGCRYSSIAVRFMRQGNSSGAMIRVRFSQWIQRDQ